MELVISAHEAHLNLATHFEIAAVQPVLHTLEHPRRKFSIADEQMHSMA